MTDQNFSRRWVEYFRHNRDHLMTIPWASDHRLSEGEQAAIAASLQAFQLGERSEGNHFRMLARAYADRTGDADYVEANRLFIEEEQRHARDLGRFLEQQGIPPVSFHWTDAVFRRVRQLAGLELCISVLITAELVAMVYYKALRDATGSPVLRSICRQILQDEVHHVLFQAGMLRRLREARPAGWAAAATCLHRAFLLVTLGVVWWGHGRVFTRAGYTPFRFAAEILCELENALLVMRGEHQALAQRAGGAWDLVRVAPPCGGTG